MLFSIIVPMYSAAPYIERCLQSVFNQNITDEKYEVIIINDGSPDNSEQIAREFSSGRANVRVFRQENKGLGGARNTGIDNALGEYIVFLDADDYLQVNCLPLVEKKISYADFEGVDVFELGCNSVSEEGIVLTTFIPDIVEKFYSGMEYYLKVKSINSACNKLYRRSSLGTLRFKEKIYSEDSEFNTRAFFFFKKVCALNLVLGNFVQTSGSITRSKNKNTKNKYIQDILSIFSSFKKFERIHSTETKIENEYFEKKYTLFTVNVFHLLFKYNMKVSRAIRIKEELKKEHLYMLTYESLERKRDLFRRLLRYSFPAYIFMLKLRNNLN